MSSFFEWNELKKTRLNKKKIDVINYTPEHYITQALPVTGREAGDIPLNVKDLTRVHLQTISDEMQKNS